MADELYDFLDVKTGAFKRDNDEKIVELTNKANQIRDEFAKISKHKLLGQSVQELLELEIFVLDDTEKPEYELTVYGMDRERVCEICTDAIDDFIVNEHYSFHKFHNQLNRELSRVISNSLNESVKESEFWCSTAERSMTIFGTQTYLFYVIKFDKNKINSEITFCGKRHPLMDSLRIEWELQFGKYFSMSEKINYNEMFRRAVTREYFLYHYQDDMNVLSVMKYESEINKGSFVALELHRDDSFEEKEKNYCISLRLSAPIKVVSENYKKLRKLLEIAKNGLSLLLNDKAEVFAIGKMVEQPTCNYYTFSFTNYAEWIFYKNGIEYIKFYNMIPAFPEVSINHSEANTVLQKEDIELLFNTFGERNHDIIKRIIEVATKQQHGTMVVFAENAKEETERLKASGIVISPTLLTEELVEAASSIDGALICDEKGVCYAIGTILDGEASDMADSSRGARYNSALRYKNQQRNKNKKTFIVVISEDGYIDCISTI